MLALRAVTLALALLRAAAHEGVFSADQDTQVPALNVLTADVRQLVRDLLQNGTIPGMALGAVTLDGAVDHGGFGIKSEDGEEVAAETLFGIASCSKQFLVSSFGLLMEDFANGRNVTPLPDGVRTLDWRTKIKDVLPDDWKLDDEWTTEKADFRDIFSHQSGFPRHDLSYRPTDTPLDIIRRQRYQRTAFELRQRYHYVNQLYMLGAHVISIYSGMDYTIFVKSRILEPLNMTYTTFYESEASKDGLLTQSWTATGRRIPYWFSDSAVPLAAGPMGLISNLIDMSKWYRTILNGGIDPVSNATIVPASVIEEQTSAMIVMDLAPSFPDSSLSAYGHGWYRQSYQGHELLSHPGAIPGFSDEVFLLPSDGLAIIILANADSKQGQQLAIGYRIIEDYLDLPHSASIDYAALPDSPPTPAPSGSGSIPIHEYAGTYTNPGYFDVTLCDPHSSLEVAGCEDVLSAFGTLEDTKATNATLYFSWPNVWVSHGRLRREQDNVFQFTATYLYPEGYGNNKTAFETVVTPVTFGSVTFVVEDDQIVGFGIFGFVGETTERERIGGTIQETAEIWFERLF
ncbi:beta-lactamase/transpeptidase-like protein [Cytidiella melzeri]|nr:beta-lactamase/transpeptidase-like protein [Cytidiella melzeri]